jgi:hypothetical protein
LRGGEAIANKALAEFDLVVSKPRKNVMEVGNYCYCEYKDPVRLNQVLMNLTGKVLSFILAFAIGFTIGTVIINILK